MQGRLRPDPQAAPGELKGGGDGGGGGDGNGSG